MTPTKKVKRKVFAYGLYQDGMQVAYVEAPTDKEALREINHYAMMYSQDGPVEITKLRRKP